VEEISAHEPFGPTWDAHIKVDYDQNRNPFRISLVKKTCEYMKKRGLVVNKVFVGKTRKGWHLRLWVKRSSTPWVRKASSFLPFSIQWLPAETTLKLQEMLGDDPFRQKFNASRVRRKKSGYNVLFTHKYNNGKLIGKEVYNLEMTRKVENIMFSYRELFIRHAVRNK